MRPVGQGFPYRPDGRAGFVLLPLDVLTFSISCPGRGTRKSRHLFLPANRVNCAKEDPRLCLGFTSLQACPKFSQGLLCTFSLFLSFFLFFFFSSARSKYGYFWGGSVNFVLRMYQTECCLEIIEESRRIFSMRQENRHARVKNSEKSLCLRIFAVLRRYT